MQQQMLVGTGAGQTGSAGAGPNQPNLLDYYPEMRHDGARLSWFHNANNRASLNAALASVKLIVSGDISLAEMSRYPVPIMARPPLGVSDLTLENWLSDVSQARKGIKLTFTSTRTVEPAFRVLARHAEHLKGPLILNADILSRPASPTGGRGAADRGTNKQQQQQQQPVDAWTFLMLCRTRFPKSIISIGWCPSGAPLPAADAEPSISSMQAPGADSSSATADCSMFELDLMMEQSQARPSSAGSAGAAPISSNHLHHQHHHRFNSPILHLSSGHLQHSGHPHQQGGRDPRQAGSSARSLQSHYPLVQQLAAVAVAANASGQQPAQLTQMISQHQRNLIGGVALLQQHQHQHQHQHRASHQYHSSSGLLSSNGSLNSSSGNSSGSPSPTSPLGHHLALMSPGQQQQHSHSQLQRHLQQRRQQQQQLSPERHRKSPPVTSSATTTTGVLGWPAVAAAAMVAASTAGFAGHEHELEHDCLEAEEHEQDQEQLPLNLNINEADPQHTSAGSVATTLEDLAQTIQSLQRQSNSLSSISNSLAQSTGAGSQSQSQQPTSEATAAALALASKIFNNNTAAGQHLLMSQVVLQQQQQQQQASRTWEHISKKAALCNRLNSNSPSPVSTSPKGSVQQQQQMSGGHLLCFRRSQPEVGQQQQQQHLAKQQAKVQHEQQPGATVGYTREMIDKMASLVKEYNLTQPITFPVEARRLTRRPPSGSSTASSGQQQQQASLSELQRLLYQVGANSTLTLVAQPEDLISVEDLLLIRKHFAPSQILFDLPDDLAASLRHELELH